MKRRRSLSEYAEETRKKRIQFANKKRRIEETGWQFMNLNKQSPEFVSPHSGDSFAVTSLSRNSTPASIFKSIFHPQLITSVLNRHLNENRGMFLESRGIAKGKSYDRTLVPTVGEVWLYLAARVWIQIIHKQEYSQGTMKQAFHHCHEFFMKVATEKGALDRVVGEKKIKRIHNIFALHVGTDDELLICESFKSIISTLGEVFSGDEKLFKYVGKSGLVRLCPNKPSKLGLWHYQGCVFLSCDLPYVVYSKCHCATTKLDMSVPCAAVVKDWCEVIQTTNSKAVIVMDSYYLDSEGRNYMANTGQKYIAALKPDRFKQIRDYLQPNVTESGMSAFAKNDEKEEMACFHWCLDSNVGKKLVLSNSFKDSNLRNKKGQVQPIYDHYKSGFNGCDVFNKKLYGNTWPYSYRYSPHHGTDILCGWDYLFSTSIINAYHVWIDLDASNRENVTIYQFCKTLVSEMIESTQ